MRISVASTEYVPVVVTATKAGVSYNPTSDVVAFAYLPTGQVPTSTTTTYAGVWETANGQYIAQGLVGPANGGTVLAVGAYTVWVKITDNPEVPFKQAGGLTIY